MKKLYSFLPNTKDYMVHDYTTDNVHKHIIQINGKEYQQIIIVMHLTNININTYEKAPV